MSTRRAPKTRSHGALSSDNDPIVVSSKIVHHSSFKRKKPVPAPDSEVIEIFSSDEESQPARKRQATVQPKEQVKQLQHETRTLKQKLDKLQGELERARKENNDLKVAATRSAKVVLDNYEDCISCEICTQTMWSPYILSGCGHTYCMKDLVEWFNTCLVKHVAAHPAWQRTREPLFHLRNPRAPVHPLIAHIIAQQGPQPEYTCPTCRAVVHTKPVEDFSLKAIIHALATSAGEAPPQPEPAAVVKRRGKGKAKAVESPFDAFFGKDT